MMFNPEKWSLSQDIAADPGAFRTFTEFMIPGTNFNNETVAEYSKLNTYIGNSTGHRGPEIAGADILTNGCSQTFGVGVEEEQTWPHLLAKLTGLSYANIAIPGNSIPAIVQSTIAYVRDYGAPKHICLNLPDFFRAYLPSRSDVFVYDRSNPNTGVQNMALGLYAQDQSAKTWPAFAKRPYSATEVLPQEVPLFLAMMSINHIVEFCRVASINLYITTWHEATHQLLGHMKDQAEIDPEFTRLDMSKYSPLPDIEHLLDDVPDSVPLDCHADLADSPDWDVASDLTHIGAHTHLHFAELFAEQINKVL